MVVGSDQRQIITSFNEFPYSTVVAVDSVTSSETFPGLTTFSLGTGIVIAPNHVLTSGHNVYDNESNKEVDATRVTISAI